MVNMLKKKCFFNFVFGLNSATKRSQDLAVSNRCGCGNPACGTGLYAQGEFLFPAEVTSVFRAGAGQLLNRVVQLNCTQ